MLSIIIPVDKVRLPLLVNTLNEYYKYDMSDVEVLLVTRTISKDDIALEDYHNTRIIPYVWEAKTFSQSMALNIGIMNALSNTVIVTSPEVRPKGDVLSQLRPLMGKNIICQVWDCNIDGTYGMSLVNKYYRSDTAAMHFLGMFNKKDILYINGWDEDFMLGQAYDDDDFGARFRMAGFEFEVHDEIEAEHQYHPRNGIQALWDIDKERYLGHIYNEVIRVQNGIIKLSKDNEGMSNCHICGTDTTGSLCNHGENWCCDCYEESNYDDYQMDQLGDE